MINALHILWNPSEGIDLGFFMLRFYSLSWVLAFGLGWYIMKPIFTREQESVESLDKLFIYTLVATMLGARLGHVIFYQPELFNDDPWSVLLPISTQPSIHFTGFAGLASHGAAIAIILTMFYIQKRVIKRSFLWILDRIVIPVSLGAIFIRLGNFFNSEIVGIKTDSALGIKFLRDEYGAREAMQLTQTTSAQEAYQAIATQPQFATLLANVSPKHPAQLYEAICYFIAFLILMFLYWKKDLWKRPGVVFGSFLILIWGARFMVEFVKLGQTARDEQLFLNTGQILSIPLVIAGVILLYRGLKKPAEV